MNFYYNPLLSRTVMGGVSSIFSPIKKHLKKSDNLNLFCSFKNIRKKNSLKVMAFKMLSNLDKLMSIEYSLDNYHRSNQDTCLVHKPIVSEGQWIESGDLLADCSASVGGELSLGQNILIAYMPWEGYNFEDAILISERLVFDDLYTSIHIEKYQVEIKDTKLGMEEITRTIPDVREESIRHLDLSGIAKLGSWVEEGDILIGKVTPINKKSQSNYQKLLYTILEKPVLSIRDSSLRAPKGIKAKVVGIEIFKKNKNTLVSKQLGSGLLTAVGGNRPLQKINAQKTKTINEKTNKTISTFKQMTKVNISKKKVVSVASIIQPTKKILRKSNLKNILNLLTNKNQNPLIKSKFDQRDFNYDQLSNVLQLSKSFFTLPDFFEMYKQSNVIHQIKNKKNISGYFNSKFINNINSFSYSGYKKINYNLYQDYLLSGQKQEVSISELVSPEVILQSKTIGVQNKSITPLTSLLRKKVTSEQSFYPSMGELAGLKKRLSFRETNYCLENEKKPWTNLLKKTRSIKTKVSKNKNHLGQQNKNLLTGVSSVQVYLAEKRRVQVGDKMAGRHGNKGIISQIFPSEDMPFLPDGTALDMVLNPLGVPSRMNVGQLYECLLGLAGKHLGENFKVFPFDEIYGAEASRSFVYSKLNEARLKTGKYWLFSPNSPGKIRLYDGRTGESFDQAITVGYAYMLRLVHMVDDKIHARSTGPYSLVTQQPLRGRSKQGGQRLGEMEVWALEGYGAAFTLLEMLTIKSDDMSGRLTLWSNLILNKEISIGTPESFKVLMCELQALCLDVNLFRVNSK